MKVVYFGSFDERASPRVRLLRQGLELAGVEVVDCHARGSIVPRWRRLLAQLPRAARGADAILVGKPGQREVPLAAPVARALGVPLVVDYFASLWLNEVVERRRVRPDAFQAWKLRTLDRIAWRAAHRCLVDTLAHGRTIARTLEVDPKPMRRVFVGAEELFRPLPAPTASGPLEALFIGTFIPFHGADVIVEAAARLRGEPLVITLLGDGPARPAVERLAAQRNVDNLRFEAPLPYSALPMRMAAADLCLVLFADSPTARVVIPKKVFAALACARPIVTADTEGIREALDESTAFLCEPGDPESLVAALRRALDSPHERAEKAEAGRALHERRFTAAATGTSCRDVLAEVVAARDPEPDRTPTGAAS